MIHLNKVYSRATIKTEEVITFLTLSGQFDSMYAEVVKHKVVMEKAQELKIEVSAEQLQQYADNFRSAHGFHFAETMLSFLTNRGLTEKEFETFCESSLLADLLKEELADEEKIKEYFFNNRSEFDRARIAIIVVKEKNLANEIIIQVKEEGKDFYALARKYSIDEETKHAGGYMGLISRQALPAEIGSKIFNASAGDLLGPFQENSLFQVILIEEIMRSELNEEVKGIIKEKIFREWLSTFIEQEIKIFEHFHKNVNTSVL